MQNINILDPNLGTTHPTLVPWVQTMRIEGYSNDQIQMYFRQQMTTQMAKQVQQHTVQHHRQTQPHRPVHTNHEQQRQQKLQMAQHIVQVYTGSVTIEQVQAMPFDRVQQLHNEIVHRLNQHPDEMTHNYNDTAIMCENEKPKKPKKPKKRKLREVKSCEIENERPAKKIKLTDYNNYKRENEMLKKENEILKERIVSMENNKSEKLNVMNLDELNQLKIITQNKIKLIEEAEKQLIDNMYKCVACMDNAKNISFTDGCNHIALCDKCEASLEPKLCPLCQTPYNYVKKINF